MSNSLQLRHRVSPPEAAQEFLARKQARVNFISFLEYTRPNYRPGRHHYLVADYLHRMMRGEILRLIIRQPPRHGKSEMVSRGLPAFLFGHNPNEKIIACSYGADLARDMNADVQEIMDSPEYLNLFPKIRLPDTNIRTISGKTKRNSDTFGIIGHDGSYLGTGVGGPITGKGATWLILDDPIKNREEADSPVYREKVWRWYSSTARTRLAPGARVIVCMTPWHADDIGFRLIERAQQDPKATQWTVIDLPDIAEEPIPSYDFRQPGEALWPEQWPLDALEAVRADLDDYDYFPLYRLKPLAAGGVEWPREYFPDSMLFDEFPKRDIVCKTIGLDPSKGASDKAGDYSAMVSAMLTKDGLIWLDADLQRKPGDQIPDWAFATQCDFQADAFAIETNQFQELILRHIETLSRKYETPLPIDGMVNSVPKDIRIRRWGPYFKAGRVRIRNNKGGKLLLEQFRAFPKGNYDDGPDAAEMALRAMTRLCTARMQNQPKGIKLR